MLSKNLSDTEVANVNGFAGIDVNYLPQIKMKVTMYALHALCS